MMWNGTYKPPTPEEMQEIEELINSLFEPRRKMASKRTPRKYKRKSAARVRVKR